MLDLTAYEIDLVAEKDDELRRRACEMLAARRNPDHPSADKLPELEAAFIAKRDERNAFLPKKIDLIEAEIRSSIDEEKDRAAVIEKLEIEGVIPKKEVKSDTVEAGAKVLAITDTLGEVMYDQARLDLASQLVGKSPDQIVEFLRDELVAAQNSEPATDPIKEEAEAGFVKRFLGLA